MGDDGNNNKPLNVAGAEEHVNRWCALPAPYPEPRVVRPNQYYALLLLEDYAGAVSELTAINQYFYHYLTFYENYGDVAELQECISIIEMLHLELLGKTIRKLGVEPEYRTLTNNQRIYWNASFVYYGQNICSTTPNADPPTPQPEHPLRGIPATQLVLGGARRRLGHLADGRTRAQPRRRHPALARGGDPPRQPRGRDRHRRARAGRVRPGPHPQRAPHPPGATGHETA